MSEKQSVMLVTGANAGLGLATVKALAKTNAEVVMLCRDEVRGEQARQEAIRETGNHQIKLMLADLADMHSIKRFSEEFHTRYNRLDVLVNNAGVITLDRRETKQGLELQFGVNHVGHFLLTRLLSDLLTVSEDARVVIVSSGAHKVGRVHFDDINLKKKYNVIRAYSQSKLANLLFASKLAEIYQDKTVSVNCCHPGAVATRMGVDRETGFGMTITSLLRPFFLTPEQGAETTVALAVTALGSQNEAAYYYKMKKVEKSARANDQTTINQLWQLSIQITNDYAQNSDSSWVV